MWKDLTTQFPCGEWKVARSHFQCPHEYIYISMYIHWASMFDRILGNRPQRSFFFVGMFYSAWCLLIFWNKPCGAQWMSAIIRGNEYSSIVCSSSIVFFRCGSLLWLLISVHNCSFDRFLYSKHTSKYTQCQHVSDVGKFNYEFGRRIGRGYDGPWLTG